MYMKILASTAHTNKKNFKYRS